MKRFILILSMLVMTASLALAKEKGMVIKGEVTSVDRSAYTLTVKEKKGEVTLGVTDKTVIKAGKEMKALSDIKPGDKITSRAEEKGGKTVAKSIRILTAKSIEKAETKKEEKK